MSDERDAPPARADVRAALQRYWGYETLRPLQAAAIEAGLRQQDSLLVLPTGGGKSLCYQLPAVVAGRLDVVVSPLISLMKDQVDGLLAAGYPAAALHSGQPPDAQRRGLDALDRGGVRLLFLAPERLLTEGMLARLDRLGVRAFAIDEAHCISHWGHDFRPEYRRLAELRARFPRASLHAFTATATQRVREDIVTQLGLKSPRVLVGSFDRPNLIYRVLPRQERLAQVDEVLRRHPGQASIVYCMTRQETTELAAGLARRGFKVRHYHAGLPPAERQDTQERFAREDLDVIVATIAFGMGIDRSDVRCVVHASLPKSIEHYQQETGRAGRDGLEAECVLLYSPGDVVRWERLLNQRSAPQDAPGEAAAHHRALLSDMSRYAAGRTCRHRALVEYFGAGYERDTCGACDVCLGELAGWDDQTILAQKILSCVARVQERFGGRHVADVLRGQATERVRANGHDRLSTFGLLPDSPANQLMYYIHRLVDQGLLERSTGDYPVLRLNAASWAVLRGQRSVELPPPRRAAVRRAEVERDAWQDVDAELFEALRAVRRGLAVERGVPAFVIFGDTTLRELARHRPTSPAAFRAIRGVGSTKADEFGPVFLEAIRTHLATRAAQGIQDTRGTQGAQAAQTAQAAPAGGRAAAAARFAKPGVHGEPQQLEPDCNAEDDHAAFPPEVRAASARLNVNPARVQRAFELFDDGLSLRDAAEALGRRDATVLMYLLEWIAARRPERLSAWVSAETEQTIDRLADELGPLSGLIYARLDGAATFAEVRLVLARRAAAGPAGPSSEAAHTHETLG